jgi:hypothetical protein
VIWLPAQPPLREIVNGRRSMRCVPPAGLSGAASRRFDERLRSAPMELIRERLKWDQR